MRSGASGVRSSATARMLRAPTHRGASSDETTHSLCTAGAEDQPASSSTAKPNHAALPPPHGTPGAAGGACAHLPAAAAAQLK